MICAIQRFLRGVCAVSFAGLGLFSVSSSAASAASLSLLPHRAVYDLVLDRVTGSAGLDQATGRIVFELENGACVGVVQTFRQVVILGGGEIGTRVVDSQSVTTEEPDGKTMRFSTLNRVGNEPATETSGVATRQTDALTVRLSSPIKSVLLFPQSALYPAEHYRALIEAAQTGKTFLSQRIYDGADEGQTAPETFAVIGAPHPLALAEAALIKTAGLSDTKAWPIEIAYFNAEKNPVDEPNYRVSMDMLENGVSTSLMLDFTSFRLKGQLVSLDIRPETPCR